MFTNVLTYIEKQETGKHELENRGGAMEPMTD
jgi:hypothetical protein